METEITTIEKAINRLSYTVENFSRSRENDRKDLNLIIDFVNSKNEKNQETELLKWHGVYKENKRLAKEILYGTAAFTFMNESEKKQYDKFFKKQKKAKKKILKILKKMSNENNV